MNEKNKNENPFESYLNAPKKGRFSYSIIISNVKHTFWRMIFRFFGVPEFGYAFSKEPKSRLRYLRSLGWSVLIKGCYKNLFSFLCVIILFVIIFVVYRYSCKLSEYNELYWCRSETYRYVMSALIQVFGTVFVGNAIFITIRSDYASSKRKSAKTYLDLFLQYLSSKIGSKKIPVDVNGCHPWGDEYIKANLTDDEKDTVILALSWVNILHMRGSWDLTPPLPDVQFREIVKERISWLTNKEKSGYDKKYTSSMYSYDKELHSRIDNFLRSVSYNIWNRSLVKLFSLPVTLVALFSLLLVITDILVPSGLSMMATLAIILSVYIFIVMISEYKKIIVQETNCCHLVDPFELEYLTDYQTWYKSVKEI